MNQELKGAGPIALVRADVATPSAMLTALELARDDEAEVLSVVQVALGRRLEQPPVPLVDRDDRLAERVDLIDPPELHEALDRLPQVGSDAVGLGLRIESEGPVTLVGILVIPRREQLVEPFTVGRLGRLATETDGQYRAAHQSDDDLSGEGPWQPRSVWLKKVSFHYNVTGEEKAPTAKTPRKKMRNEPESVSLRRPRRIRLVSAIHG